MVDKIRKEVELALASSKGVLVSSHPDHETGEDEVFVTVFVPEGTDVPAYTEQYQDHYSKLLYGIETKYNLDIPVFFTAA